MASGMVAEVVISSGLRRLGSGFCCLPGNFVVSVKLRASEVEVYLEICAHSALVVAI